MMVPSTQRWVPHLARGVNLRKKITMKSSRSLLTLLAVLAIAALVTVTSSLNVQPGSVAALFGYGTVLTILALAIGDYRTVSRRASVR